MTSLNKTLYITLFYCCITSFVFSVPVLRPSTIKAFEPERLESKSDKIESGVVIEFDMEVLGEVLPEQSQLKPVVSNIQTSFLTAEDISKELVDWEQGGKFFNAKRSIEVLEINHKYMEDEIITIGSLHSIPEPNSFLYMLFGLALFCRRSRK